MGKQFLLSVVAPDKLVVEEHTDSMIAPGTEGYFGVWAGHEPIIVALRPGLVEYTDSTTNRHYIYVGGGFAEVEADRVTILADEAERATEVDIARAEQLLEERLEAAMVLSARRTSLLRPIRNGTDTGSRG